MKADRGLAICAQVLALMLLLGIATPAWAADTWTTPFTGVRRLSRVTSSPAWRVHAVVVDLCADGVQLRATAPSEGRRVVSSFASLVGADIAVNGDFFNLTTFKPSGLAIGNGERWTNTADGTGEGFIAFGPDRADISTRSAVVTTPPAWMREVVSGHPMLVENGARVSDTSALCTGRNPRTAAGLSADHRTLILAVVDGRSTASVGMTCTELANLMIELGAETAINLDGGGSSTMWMRGPGVVNAPSDGSQRTVANHLAIHATGSGPPSHCDPTFDLSVLQAHVHDARQVTDVDGDGLADVCARHSGGFRCQLADGAGFPTTVDGPAFASSSGWSDVTNYSAIRMADVDGDGLADVCARANAGVYCYPSTGTGFGARLDGPVLSDASGWNKPQYYSTLRVAELDGDGRDDLCARAAAGIRCWASTGSGFGAAIVGPELSDATGWDAPEYYATIRMGDVDGDGRDDLCARSSAGMQCWLSTGSGFATSIAGPAWSDASGWNRVQYWSTIHLRDVDGDGRADLCARAADSFQCHLSTGSGFGDPIVGPTWSDATGWDDVDNFATIRLGDLDGDGDLDVCARANAGIRCMTWEGSGFSGAGLNGPELSDAAGWNLAEHYMTLRMADVNGDGRDDLCGRDTAGVSCYLGDGGAFATRIVGPAWSDASGWSAAQYTSTFRVAGPRCRALTETCNGRDDDCDGAIDEGCVAESDTTDVAADTGPEVDANQGDTWAPDAGADTAALSDVPQPPPADTVIAQDGALDGEAAERAGHNVVSACACRARAARGNASVGMWLAATALFLLRRRRA